jgi:hypothetical protein
MGGKVVAILPTASVTLALQQLPFTFSFIPKHPSIISGLSSA